jgi:hypothetical protein
MATLEVIEPPKPEKRYVLTLTEQEVRAIVALTGSVDGRGAFRAAADRVYGALRAVVPPADMNAVPDITVRSSADAYVLGTE